MTQVAALHRYARISPQKARIIADKIRGLSVEAATELLLYSSKKAAALFLKVLQSAIANAEHNENLDVDELKVLRVFVDEGPRLKRIRARAKGRSARIIKRTSHLTVIVSELSAVDG